MPYSDYQQRREYHKKWRKNNRETLRRSERAWRERNRELDARLGEAVRTISDGDATRAQVTITFTVSFDEDEGLVADYTLKAARAKKGTWIPSGMGQMRLLEEDE